MSLNLSEITPEDLEQLKVMLAGVTDTSGRSPFRDRQLKNLNTRPSAKNPVPLFVWSASTEDVPEYDGRVFEFPKLMWAMDADANGVHREITVKSAKDQQERLLTGYQLACPQMEVLSTMDLLERQLASLSEEDRRLLIDAQQQDRRSRLQAQLANLSEDELARLVGKASAVKVTGKKVTK